MYELVSIKDLDLNSGDVLFCDTETAGLYGSVTLFQCYVIGWKKVKIVEAPHVTELNEVLNKHKTVWFNASYDLTVLNKTFKDFEDLMLLSRLAFPELDRCSLDNVLRHVLKYCPYSEQGIKKGDMQKTKWVVGELENDHYVYASLDVLLMPQVYNKVKEYRSAAVYKQDIESIRSCLKMQKNGFVLETKRALDYKKKLEEELEADLKTVDINVNSSKQCKEALNSLSSDKSTLLKIITSKNSKSELAKKILFTRKKLKSLTTVTKYLTVAANDGRVYGKFSPTTISGRLRSSNENLQNVPRNIRHLFGFENKDKMLIYADYSQLELRTIASILNVKSMVEAFKTGKDVHMMTAKKIFGPQATDSQRTLSKGYNFAMLYGASPNGIRNLLGDMGIFVSVEKVARDKKAWLKIYPEIERWHRQCRLKAFDNATSRTALGRVYKSNSPNEQANIMNQGSGAEVSKVSFNNMINAGLKVVNFVHDAYIVESDANNFEKDMDLVGQYMLDGWRKVAKVFKIKDVPMPVDVYVGYNWGELEKGECIVKKRFG